VSGRLFAIVPMKSLTLGKSRLYGRVPESERLALNRWLLDHTLSVAAEFPGAERTIVVSGSAEILDIARQRGMIAIADPEGADLNAALAAATDVAVEWQADAVFVLPVDLPLLTAEALRRAVAAVPAAPGCLLVTDRHDEGTNLMVQQPVQLRRYRYGLGSCGSHVAAAEEAGMTVTVCRDPDLSFDLDWPDDYAVWQAEVGMPKMAS
jgi:2-phospho-L-lactate guanylyltransferase